MSITLRFAAALLLAAAAIPAAAAPAQHFATPEAALAALRGALKAGDTARLTRIVGDDYKALVTTGEPQVDTQNYAEATLRLNTLASLQAPAADRRILVIGAEAWPFPIPIVRDGKGWFFDSAEGEDELLNRRIGENELVAIAVLGAYGEAQTAFAATDRDGDGVREYARRLMSSPGKTDGLYWPAEAGQPTSPWGPLIAASAIDPATRTPDQPYRGYRYKVLTAQGPGAAGGAYDYVINGHMVGGFGLVAFPADPGTSGVMTFIVNQNGQIFEKPLGPDTVAIATAMTGFNPGDGWTAVTPPADPLITAQGPTP
jgi:hypothetical protein